MIYVLIIFIILIQWEERDSTSNYNEKSNGNFKVPYAKKDVKQESEVSPSKKPRTGRLYVQQQTIKYTY